MTETVKTAPETKAQPTTTPRSSAGGSSSHAVQLKASLRGHDYDTQVQMLSPDGGGGDVHAAAARGISGSGGALPAKDKIQQSFGGYDISNVQAHTDSNAIHGAAAMGANAYATGNHVVLGKGGADLHTQAHEAAHVVQQRAGVSLSGGVGKSGDAYEQHADAVADLVVQGKSAEGLLGEMSGGGGGGGEIQMDESEDATTVEKGPPGSKSNPIELGCPLYLHRDSALRQIEKSVDRALADSSAFAKYAQIGSSALQRAADNAFSLKNASDGALAAIDSANQAIRVRQNIAAISNIGHCVGLLSTGFKALGAAIAQTGAESLTKIIKTAGDMEKMSGFIKNVAGTYAAATNGNNAARGQGAANAEMVAVQAVQNQTEVVGRVVEKNASDVAFEQLVLAFGMSQSMNDHLGCAQSHALLLEGIKMDNDIRGRFFQIGDDVEQIGLNMKTAEESLSKARAPARAAAAGTPHLAAKDHSALTLVDWVAKDKANADTIFVTKTKYFELQIQSGSFSEGLPLYTVTTLNPEAQERLRRISRVVPNIILGPGEYFVPRDVGTFLFANCKVKVEDGGVNAFLGNDGRKFLLRPSRPRKEISSDLEGYQRTMSMAIHYGTATVFHDSGR